MDQKVQPPAVGVAVVVEKDGKILVGRDGRKGGYALPGGHWETGETLKEAAAREVLEESGVSIVNLRLLSLYDFYRPDKQRSYVSIWFVAEYVSGELRDNVQESRYEWSWYTPREALTLELWEVDVVLVNRYVSALSTNKYLDNLEQTGTITDKFSEVDSLVGR